MTDLSTITIIGYEADLTWITAVNTAFSENPEVPARPPDPPIISIPGRVPGPELLITLKTAGPDEYPFQIAPPVHPGGGIILIVPNHPFDPKKDRLGPLLNTIVRSIAKHQIQIGFAEANEGIGKIIQRLRRYYPSIDEPFEEALRPDNITTRTYDLEIIFHPDLSPEQIEKSFAALADYYRACGGTGFRVQFEEQDVPVPEVAYGGR
jgi:hypothetical protein